MKKIMIIVKILIILFMFAYCENGDKSEIKNLDIWYKIKFIQQYQIAIDASTKYEKIRNGKMLYNQNDLKKLNELFPMDHIKDNDNFDADYYYIYLNIIKNKVIVYYDYHGLHKYQYEFDTKTLKHILDDYAERIDIPLNLVPERGARGAWSVKICRPPWGVGCQNR